MHRETIETPFGRCVLISLADEELADALAALPADERAIAATLSPVRQREWISGRTALHAALGDTDTPLLSSPRGAPLLPTGHAGSVSHKGNAAAAIVGPTVDIGSNAIWIGVDIERAAPPKIDIARRILTARELQALSEHVSVPVAQLEPTAHEHHGRAVTLRFSIKEAIYKAIDPIVNRYVGFQEVELELGTPSGARVSDVPLVAWQAATRVTSELPADIEAAWQELEIAGTSFWLAIARATPSYRGWERNT